MACVYGPDVSLFGLNSKRSREKGKKSKFAKKLSDFVFVVGKNVLRNCMGSLCAALRFLEEWWEGRIRNRKITWIQRLDNALLYFRGGTNMADKRILNDHYAPL